MYEDLAILAVFAFVYSVVAGRLERTVVSGPMLFTLLGLVIGPLALGWFEGDVTSDQLRVLADLTLALVLFIDAANADLPVLWRNRKIPVRMLFVGLPGVILLGSRASRCCCSMSYRSFRRRFSRQRWLRPMPRSARLL